MCIRDRFIYLFALFISSPKFSGWDTTRTIENKVFKTYKHYAKVTTVQKVVCIVDGVGVSVIKDILLQSGSSLGFHAMKGDYTQVRKALGQKMEVFNVPNSPTACDVISLPQM